MNKEKEMTAPVVSVGADTEQSSQNLTDNSLTDFDPDFKGADDDLYREIVGVQYILDSRRKKNER